MRLVQFFLHSLRSYGIAAVVIFFLVHRILFFKPGTLETITSYTVYPLIVAQKYLIDPITQWQHTRKSAEEFYKQIAALHEHNEQLQAELVALQAQQQFLAETQELRAYKTRYKQSPHALAHIIFKQLGASEQFFLVDCGSATGIKQDMVAVYKNCLLGRVTQVLPQYSKITLITDAKCNVAAFCANSRSDGITQGVNATDTLELKFVSHLNKMQIGDTVLSSGQGLVFPHGFGIGTISECSVDGLYYHVLLKPLLDFAAVQYCYIIQKGD